MASSDIFTEYMANVASAGTAAPSLDEAWATWSAGPGAASYAKQWALDNTGANNPYAETGFGSTQLSYSKLALKKKMMESPEFLAYYNSLGGTKYPKGAEEIGRGFEPAFGYVTGSSKAAGDLLRRGYEDAFRARASGFAGEQAELERGLGSQVAGQGLSADIAQRMLAEQRAKGLGALAGARSDYGAQLYSGLSELTKGTGTELAGLSSNQAAVMANYLATLKGAKAAASGAKTGAFLGAAGQLGAAAILACDRWVKRGLVPAGEALGVPIFEFSYIDGFGPEGRFRGPMAQDIAGAFPGAVVRMGSGALGVVQCAVPPQLRCTRVG